MMHVVTKSEAIQLLSRLKNGKFIVLPIDEPAFPALLNECRIIINESESVVLLDAEPLTQLDLYNTQLNDIKDLSLKMENRTKTIVGIGFE